MEEAQLDAQVVGSFKEQNAPEKRRLLSEKIRTLYPDRLPVIVEKPHNANVGTLLKKKYLTPADITVAKFMVEVSRQLQVAAPPRADRAAFFLFAKKTLLQASALMSSVYAQHADEDGFLYLTIVGENPFGGAGSSA